MQSRAFQMNYYPFNYNIIELEDVYELNNFPEIDFFLLYDFSSHDEVNTTIRLLGDIGYLIHRYDGMFFDVTKHKYILEIKSRTGRITLHETMNDYLKENRFHRNVILLKNNLFIEYVNLNKV